MPTLALRHRLLLYITAAFAGALLAHVVGVGAEQFFPLPGGDTGTGLEIPVPEGETALEKIENILGPIGRVIRILMGVVAVVFIVISGLSMVVAGDNEETVKNQKSALTYAIVGLMMISIAGPVAEIFDFRQGNILEDGNSLQQRAALFDATTQIILTFLKWILAAVATAMFITAGATMIGGSYNEELVNRAKKNLAMGVGGIFLVFISDLLIKRILFNATYNTATSEVVIQIDQNLFISQLIGFMNIMVSFVGPIMVLGLIIGGVLYASAGGDEERTGMAKKIMMNSVIGIIVIYGAFALVSTVITGIF